MSGCELVMAGVFATHAILSALDRCEPGETLHIPSGTYLIQPSRITIRKPIRLVMQPDTELRVIPNGRTHYYILRIKANDVTVSGGTLVGDRYHHKSARGEWGYGISVRAGQNVTISGVTAKDMWGDGFYVEGGKDVTFDGVVSDNNRRQGLSIVHAESVTVRNSLFSNTSGTKPGAGIDIEPDRRRRVDGVTISSSAFFGNAGPGIKIHDKKGPIDNVKIGDCQFGGNAHPINSKTFSWIERKMIGLGLLQVTEAEIAGQG
jgi:polygalacturonase